MNENKLCKKGRRRREIENENMYVSVKAGKQKAKRNKWRGKRAKRLLINGQVLLGCPKKFCFNL